MKNRPEGFLKPEFIDPNSEQFDYIKELHRYLWRFVRFAFPDANGDLSDFVDPALDALEAMPIYPKRTIRLPQEDL